MNKGRSADRRRPPRSGTTHHSRTCGGSRRKKPPCNHSQTYLTYALNKKNNIAYRTLSCRHCNNIVILPAYMEVFNHAS